MNHRIRKPANTGDEFDTFSKKARKILCYLTKPGVSKEIKKKYKRKERKWLNKVLIREGLNDLSY